MDRLIAFLALPALTVPIGWAVLLYLFVRTKSTIVTIANGRIQVESGIVFRRVRNYDLWRIRDITLSQGPWNRVTGDATLKFDKVLVLRGLATGTELKDIYQNLLNLSFVLRGNQVVKGIIQ